MKEEAARIAAAVAAVSASPSPPSRVASSNAEVVVSATAAVTRDSARVSLFPRDQFVVLPHPMPRLLLRPTYLVAYHQVVRQQQILIHLFSLQLQH